MFGVGRIEVLQPCAGVPLKCYLGGVAVCQRHFFIRNFYCFGGHSFLLFKYIKNRHPLLNGGKWAAA
jgi:hypothetical protein